MLSIKTLACRLILLLCLIFSARVRAEPPESSHTQTITATNRLRKSLATADRLIVTPVAKNYPSQNVANQMLFELKGAGDIASLVQGIEFDEDDSNDGIPCLCYGTHDIQFYCGNASLGTLNYKHFSRLGFGGEHDLTAQSTLAFAAWFGQHGFSEFQKGVDANLAARRKKQMNAKRAAEQCPETQRHLIPEYKVFKWPKPTIEKNTDKNSEEMELVLGLPLEMDPHARAAKAREIVCSIEDKPAFMKACLMAFAIVAPDEDIGIPNEEPLATLYYFLEIMTIEEFTTIIRTATETSLFEGAFLWAQNSKHQFRLKIPDAIWSRVYSSVLSSKTKREKIPVLMSLSRERGPECMALRLKLAASGMPQVAPSDENECWLYLIISLARQKVPEARTIILERLILSPDGDTKLGLEVALAHYDGAEKLAEKHLNHSDWFVSDSAKELLKAK